MTPPDASSRLRAVGLLLRQELDPLLFLLCRHVVDPEKRERVVTGRENGGRGCETGQKQKRVIFKIFLGSFSVC